jgi:hypothetical protein
MIGDGPPVDRAARAILVLATAWFVFTAAWGIFGIPGGGHLGAGSTGTMMAAEQIVRWKIPYPARSWYTGIRPTGAALMCHHPYGQYYPQAVSFFFFGHHDFLINLPAIFMSAAIPSLLYGIAKERWGAPLGAVAAAAYVVVPIAVGFSGYWNLETICIFGSLLFFWGHSRHTTTSRRRYLLASLAGLCFVCSGDWVGYLLVAPTLAWCFLRAFVLPVRATPRFRLAPYALWWSLSVSIMVTMLALWVWLFLRVDQMSQWFGAAESRGGGGLTTLRDTLRARAGWIDFSFTPLAIGIGKIAAPVCLLRLLVERRDEESYAPSLLFGAVIQYVAFKRGADVHVFWPHYFAAYFALALAQLAGTIGSIAGWVAARLHRARQGAAVLTGLAVGLLPVVAMVHDGVTSLWVWRRTGGRYDDHGTLIRSDIDLLYVLEQIVLPKTARGTQIDAHRGVGGWEFLWKYQGTFNALDVPTVGATDVDKHPFWIGRGSGLSGNEQRKIAASAHVRVFGDGWIVDQREAAAPLDSYPLREREPKLFEWLLYGGTEPIRSIGAAPDPWTTWEWRTHLGQPAPLPAGEPTTLDEIRIAHNVAVAEGDAEATERWRATIERALDRSVATAFTEGVRLLGVRVTGGVEPRIECWFEFSGERPLGEASFNVRSTVEARATLSLIPPDPTDREMAFPPLLPTALWRPRFLYETTTVLNHRIGSERYWGYWRSRDGSQAPRRIDGQPQTSLTVMP